MADGNSRVSGVFIGADGSLTLDPVHAGAVFRLLGQCDDETYAKLGLAAADSGACSDVYGICEAVRRAYGIA